MLKRILGAFCIFMIVLTLVACSNSKASDLDFESGIYRNKPWHTPAGAYESAAVADKETALTIARAVLNGMIKEKHYAAQEIVFDEEEEVWVISFSGPSGLNADGTMTTGGGCYIAIQKSDGKIVGIWGGE